MKFLISCFLCFPILHIHTKTAVECSESCACSWMFDKLKVECAGLNLTELPSFGDLPIETLNISNNHLRLFPKELSNIATLITLDLSGNLIRDLDEDIFIGFTSLKYVFLGNNKISNWMDISPNHILTPAISLHTLSLAGNPLTHFNTADDRYLLLSESLKVLDLSDCKITKISGESALQGLPNLERLILNRNPLQEISQLSSASVKTLEMSNCGITALHPNFFKMLPNLIAADFSHNPKVVLRFEQDNVKSESLKSIDLSYCNLDSTDLYGFPNLIKVNLQRNMLRELTQLSFEQNVLLENIDLSYNAITQIDTTTFRLLSNLKVLDLQYNTIARIDRNLFRNNEMLSEINFSRNYITKFSKIFSKSLTHLNMSYCEITSVERDSFSGFNRIKSLDLSNNFILQIPDSLSSRSLEYLDLSSCKISSITNLTFSNFPALTVLKLSGNRFSRTLKANFFKENRDLNEIYLGDNPWNCNCGDPNFKDLYEFITNEPIVITDRKNLRCDSPEEFYGWTWDMSCYLKWFPNKHEMGNVEQIWLISMMSMIIFCCSVFLTVCIRKQLKKRKRAHAERNRLLILEEQRRIARENRMILQQEAQLNAPDPREISPPCYEEAINMPKLTFFTSMIELSARRSKRRSPSNKNGNSDHENEGENLTEQRSRSDQYLSAAASSSQPTPHEHLATVRRTRLQIANRNFPIRNENTPVSSTVVQLPPEYSVESEEHIENFQSYENSPYSKRKAKKEANRSLELRASSGSHKDSLDQITNFQCYYSSPYAKRKANKTDVLDHSASVANVEGLKDSAATSSQTAATTSQVNIVNDYFDYPSTSDSSSFENLVTTVKPEHHINNSREENASIESTTSSLVLVEKTNN